MPIDIQRCAADVLEQGYCLLPGHFPVDAIENCRVAFEPILRGFLASLAGDPNRGPCRHYIPLPFRAPFAEARFLADETVCAIVETILGRDMKLMQYATDTPLKGSVHQPVHSDLTPLFHEAADLQHPPALIAVNFPFVRVTRDNGPFEVARGSHKLPRAETIKKLEAGEIPLEPLFMEVGDVMIRDPRCLHRGSPNTTDAPRPMAVMGFERHWLYRVHAEENIIPAATWAKMSERERQLLRQMPREK